jgi:putative radical SAM enzyme (TIGR03279 family)
MNTTGGVIAAIPPGGLAEEIGLHPGDCILAVNGHPLRDVIDFRFYSAEEEVELQVRRDERLLSFHARQSYGRTLAVEFAHPTFDVDIRRCVNRCEFCFVAQSPRHMRRTLCVKDDDYRYSFLYGNFITLTNLSAEDWARIAEQHLSPLYVSVQATDSALRRKILGRDDAPDVLEQLRRLAGMGIELHTQLVLIPGLNDGPQLERSLADLADLFPAVRTVAVVPVGLTRYYKGSLRPYRPDEAAELLRQLRPWRRDFRRRLGCSFAYPSDEWYLLSGAALPSAARYDGFAQLDNGVGLTRRFLDRWARIRKRLPHFHGGRVTWACGTLIAPVIRQVAAQLMARGNVEAEVVPVVNAFYGETVTVSGLLVGRDVIEALREPGRDLGAGAVLPGAMFDAATRLTLDDLTPADISAALGVPVGLADSPRELLDVMSSWGV